MIYLDTMGHCYSDTSLEELYEFCVIKLGLRPEWNHYSKGFPHFDLRFPEARARALALGAQPISNKEMVKLVRGRLTPFTDLHLKPDVPIYEDTFYGKRLYRIDFEGLFKSK